MKQKLFILGALLISAVTGCTQNNQNRDTTSTNQIKDSKMSTNSSIETATLAGGCFWCTEAIYQQLEGVISVESGYTGGTLKNPTYKEVCSGLTGHAECVQIKYDPAKVSFSEILEVFFKTHDPTTLNRQGADVGTQYRSGVFFHNEDQKQTAEKVIAELEAAEVFNSKIVTEVTPFTVYYKAEDYHQNYFNQNKGTNQYCALVVVPKVEKFKKVFADRLKK